MEGNHRFTTTNVLLYRIVRREERNEGWMGNAGRRTRLWAFCSTRLLSWLRHNHTNGETYL